MVWSLHTDLIFMCTSCYVHAMLRTMYVYCMGIPATWAMYNVSDVWPWVKIDISCGKANWGYCTASLCYLCLAKLASPLFTMFTAMGNEIYWFFVWIYSDFELEPPAYVWINLLGSQLVWPLMMLNSIRIDNLSIMLNWFEAVKERCFWNP